MKNSPSCSTKCNNTALMAFAECAPAFFRAAEAPFIVLSGILTPCTINEKTIGGVAACSLFKLPRIPRRFVC